MHFIDPAFYASYRSVAELELMAAAGAMALVEPSTWPGCDRRYPETFLDEFERLISAEPRRAMMHGMGYATCLGLPARECRDTALVRRVLDRLPRFLGHERVAAIGEVGLDHGSLAEIEAFRSQVRLAHFHGLPIVIRLGVNSRLEALARMLRVIGEEGLPASRTLINGVAEDVLPLVRHVECWWGLTLEPRGGLSEERAVALVLQEGPERVMLHSGAGRLEGDPLAVPRAARRLIGLGFPPDQVERIVYHNPKDFFSLARPLSLSLPDWLASEGRLEAS